jgi:hypothetical protein
MQKTEKMLKFWDKWKTGWKNSYNTDRKIKTAHFFWDGC